LAYFCTALLDATLLTHFLIIFEKPDPFMISAVTLPATIPTPGIPTVDPSAVPAVSRPVEINFFPIPDLATFPATFLNEPNILPP
jgi:hypothetical protein